MKTAIIVSLIKHGPAILAASPVVIGIVAVAAGIAIAASES